MEQQQRFVYSQVLKTACWETYNPVRYYFTHWVVGAKVFLAQ